jgi:hypothetical protein
MTEAGWGPRAINALREALPLAETPAAVASEWVRRLAGGDRWRDIEHQIESLWKLPAVTGGFGGGQARTAVVTSYLRHLGERRLGKLLRRFVRRHERQLCADVLVWGTVAAAMLDNYQHRQSIDWMNGWENRPGVQQFMLTNLAQCHHALGNFAEATRLSRVALEKRFDHGSPWPHLFLALDHAEGGRIEQARAEYAKVNPGALDNESTFLYRAIWAILEPDEQRVTDRAAAHARSKHILRQLLAEFTGFRKDPGCVRTYRRVARIIARRRGTFTARLWYLAQLL